MLIRLSSQRVACRNCSLRNSYAEISRFFQTRHHGTALQFLENGTRCFNSSTLRMQMKSNDDLRSTLDRYKSTIRPNFLKLRQVDPLLSSECSNGEEVKLLGYLGTRRDISKSLSFAVLKSSDQSYCIQLVSNAQDLEGKLLPHHVTLKSLKEWTPVVVTGIIQTRARPARDDSLFGMQLINDKEILIRSMDALNTISNDLIIKEDTVFGADERHLQLRTESEYRRNLLFRDQATRDVRLGMSKLDFVEVETPLLFKSTPEGAREFLVPTRTKGLAYALPQSPQQYKQILMASGIPRYFQFARCFRDEDLRADRQPEFTQLDMEMAFSGEEDVMKTIEQVIGSLWSKMRNQPVETPFRRMTYHEAMSVYGSDKPDLRLDMEIYSITEKLSHDLISKITSLEDPVIDAFKLKLSNNPKFSRKFISDFLDSPDGKPFLENPDGQPGVFVSDVSQPLQGLGPLGHGFVMDCPDELATDHGEILILQARKNQPFSGGSTYLGNLRLALHKAAVAQGHFERRNDYKFCWVVDFPLFSPSNETDPGQGGAAGLSSTHHPFTAPKTAEDVELLLVAPEKVVAAHYDLVLNGVELGGGSRRIHDADVQEFILRDVLKMSNERLEDFRHLMNVLRSGCPPHAGFALGWDRVIAVMLGKTSVRDVIAFPKSGKGEDMLVKSPNPLTKEQLETYHLQLKE